MSFCVDAVYPPMCGPMRFGNRVFTRPRPKVALANTGMPTSKQPFAPQHWALATLQPNDWRATASRQVHRTRSAAAQSKVRPRRRGTCCHTEDGFSASNLVAAKSGSNGLRVRDYLGI